MKMKIFFILAIIPGAFLASIIKRLMYGPEEVSDDFTSFHILQIVLLIIQVSAVLIYAYYVKQDIKRIQKEITEKLEELYSNLNR